ncbi:dihydroorotase [Prosthecomicrobium sp. N25]|uniref:dihydroorotase n=1 Tax=Prosthecomicrobium sp. N25 TaxID=3129254 RepID=UPI00307745BE
MIPTPLTRRATDQPPVVFRNARIVDPSRDLDAVGTVVVAGGRILAAGPEALNQGTPEGAEVVEAEGLVVAPGLVDARVFIGEPGHEHRESLATASRAAAAGGVTTLVTMPDTDPVIDDPALVDFILRRARDDARVRVHPMAALTKGCLGQEMSEIGLLGEAGAIAFTDGRRSIANANVMRRCLTYARDFGALIVHHVEEPTLAGSGVVNAGEFATRLGLPGIPREAETIMLERDMRIVGLTGGRYHAAQISTSDSVEIVRRAKDRGLDVTCGVSVNHLCLNEMDIGTYRSFLKLSPPLRAEDDRIAVVDALADGTIDFVVSSHDPQDVETKRHPFAESADGAVGLETLLPAALRLVADGRIGWPALVAALSTRPARRLGLDGGSLKPGATADLILVDPAVSWVLDRAALLSRSKNTPFEDARFEGRVLRTLVAGETVHRYRDA